MVIQFRIPELTLMHEEKINMISKWFCILKDNIENMWNQIDGKILGPWQQVKPKKKEKQQLKNIRVTSMLIVVGSIGTIPNSLEKKLEKQNIREGMKTIQLLTLLRLVQILRWILQDTSGHLDTSERRSIEIYPKKSQDVWFQNSIIRNRLKSVGWVRTKTKLLIISHANVAN